VMEKEAKAIFARQGISEKAMALVRGAEMRYYGQLRDIDIFLPETTLGSHFDEATLKELIATFHTRHRELYGHSDPTLPVTIALLKLRVIGKRRPFTLAKVPLNGADPGVALKRKRPVYWKERNGFVQTPCYDGDKLHHGAVIPGPAIIEEKKTTVVIPPGCVAEVDAYDNYLVTMKG